MSKYSYLNLNQKMIKIRKKIPALIRKRYSEEVDYDFVKLDDINQFLTPALNRYGVDFDILREIPTQTDSSGNPVYLTADGNLWRYEADLEICWTNADRPEEKIISCIHLVGTNDAADKAKGTAMTYGLKYYLLNKFNIPQNGDEDPDMRSMKTAREPQQEKALSGKKEEKKKKDMAGARENDISGFIPQDSLNEGLGDVPEHISDEYAGGKMLRSGNAVSSGKTGNMPDRGKQNSKIQQMKECKDAGAAPKENPDKVENGLGKQYPEESECSGSDRTEDGEIFADRQKKSAIKKEEQDVLTGMNESEEEDFDFSEEGVPESEEAKGDGFRSVKDEDEIPFSEEEEETEEDSDQTVDDELEKAKAVICNFGYFKGHTLGEMLETQKGWESLKWIAARYMGANEQMKEAARILVDADAYMPKAA